MGDRKSEYGGWRVGNGQDKSTNPQPPSPKSAKQIKEIAHELGFDQVGITCFADLAEAEEGLHKWTQAGKHGTMQYLEDFKKRREDFLQGFPNAKSVIVLGVNYYSHQSQVRSHKKNNDEPRGRIARYAWGKDYHQVIGKKHEELIERLKQKIGSDFNAVSCVDSKPVLERYAGIKAGFGFAGKNTMLLSQHYGPWLFLSEIVTDQVLEEDLGFEGDCGTCSKCQVECPTGALNEDYSLDARLCISYLTIEHKGVISRELRPKMKDWVFGCDECLTICPFTSKEKETTWTELKPEAGKGEWLDFEDLFNVSSNRLYQDEYKKTAILRANRKQLMRNACIVLGNSGKKSALPYLEKALQDQTSLVRIHAVWALGELPFEEARQLIKRQQGREDDEDVLAEIRWVKSRNNIPSKGT